MKSSWRKAAAFLLAFMLVAAPLTSNEGAFREGFGLTAHAAEIVGSWSSHDCDVTLDGDGTLYVSKKAGDGRMADYFGNYYAPWKGNNIKKVVVSEGVTRVGARAFFVCESLESVELPAGLTAIGDEAFDFCTGLTNLTLPEGLTTIGDDAFDGCTGLTNLTLPEGLTTIGDEAFKSCKQLESVTLPEGLTTIGDKAFMYCNKLRSLTIPSTVTYIGSDAFYCCKDVTDVYCYPDAADLTWNEKWCDDFYSTLDDTGSGAEALELFEKRTICHVREGQLEGYREKYDQNNRVTDVNVTFKPDLNARDFLAKVDDGTTSLITLTEDETTLAYDNNYTGLNVAKTLTINLNGKHLDVSIVDAENTNVLCPVKSNSGILRLTDSVGGGLMSGIDDFMADGGNVIIESGTFEISASGFSVTDGNSITIYGGTFILPEEAEWKPEWNDYLAEGKKVKKIDDRIYSVVDAFINIENAVVNLNGDNSVCSITVGEDTIEDLSDFDITYGTADDSHTATSVPTEPNTYYAYVEPKTTNTDYKGTAKSESFTIENQWVSGDCIVKLDRKTGTLTVSKKEGNGVMANYPEVAPWCSGAVKKIVVEDGVTVIGKCAFYCCENATSVTLPKGLKSIRANAFGYCASLTSVTIPATVTYIGSDAFYRCNDVTDVFCYPNAKDLTWAETDCDDFIYEEDDEGNLEKSKITICHVKGSQVGAYNAKFNAGEDGDVNVLFVGDLTEADNIVPGENNPKAIEGLTYTGEAQNLIAPPAALPKGCDHIEYGQKITEKKYVYAVIKNDTVVKPSTYAAHIVVNGVTFDSEKAVCKKENDRIIFIYDNNEILSCSADEYDTLELKLDAANSTVYVVGLVKNFGDSCYRWTTDEPQGTDVGEYDVYYKFAGAEGYNNYVASDPITATIATNDISDATVTMADNSADVESVVLGEKTLTADTDYTVSYKQGETALTEKPEAVGEYTAVITGKGSYKGSVSKAFAIHVHSFSEAWETDKTQHWHKCIEETGTCDGTKKDAADHTYGETGDARFTCSVCKYVDEDRKAAAMDADNAAAAKAVSDLINSIGKITYTDDCKTKIDTARSAYNALTEKQQGLVQNYIALIYAENLYDALANMKKAEEDAAKALADKTAAEAAKQTALANQAAAETAKAAAEKAAKEAAEKVAQAEADLKAANEALEKVQNDADEMVADAETAKQTALANQAAAEAAKAAAEKAAKEAAQKAADAEAQLNAAKEDQAAAEKAAEEAAQKAADAEARLKATEEELAKVESDAAEKIAAAEAEKAASDKAAKEAAEKAAAAEKALKAAEAAKAASDKAAKEAAEKAAAAEEALKAAQEAKDNNEKDAEAKIAAAEAAKEAAEKAKADAESIAKDAEDKATAAEAAQKAAEEALAKVKSDAAAKVAAAEAAQKAAEEKQAAAETAKAASDKAAKEAAEKAAAAEEALKAAQQAKDNNEKDAEAKIAAAEAAKEAAEKAKADAESIAKDAEDKATAAEAAQKAAEEALAKVESDAAAKIAAAEAAQKAAEEKQAAAETAKAASDKAAKEAAEKAAAAVEALKAAQEAKDNNEKDAEAKIAAAEAAKEAAEEALAAAEKIAQDAKEKAAAAEAAQKAAEEALAKVKSDTAAKVAAAEAAQTKADKSAKEAAEKAAAAEAAKKAAEEAKANNEKDAEAKLAAAKAAMEEAENAAKAAEADKNAAELSAKEAADAQAAAEALEKQAEAEKAAAEKKAAEEKAAADQANADIVIKLINAIGEVKNTNECENAIISARTAYNMLTETQKALVSNYSVLTAAEDEFKIISKYFAPVSKLCEMAIKDYEVVNGTKPAKAEAQKNADGTLSITLTDKDGKVIDTYRIDPVTAIGINSQKRIVNLPKTGMSGVHKVFAALAALMGITGVGLVKKSRKKEDEED